MNFKDTTDIFDDIRDVRKNLKPYRADGSPMSEAGKYARSVRDVDGAPAQTNYLAMNRTLPPEESIMYGVNKEEAVKIPGPYYVGAPLMKDYGTHRAVWNGWRPERPELPYNEVGIDMMLPSRNYMIESSMAIPTDHEIVNMAVENATSMWPITPENDPIPDPWRFQKMDVQEYTNMSGLGEDVKVLGVNVGSVAQGIADGIKAKYEADATAARSAQGTYMMTSKPAASGGLPLGTVALVGGVALAAMFLLPKIMGKR